MYITMQYMHHVVYTCLEYLQSEWSMNVQYSIFGEMKEISFACDMCISIIFHGFDEHSLILVNGVQYASYIVKQPGGGIC